MSGVFLELRRAALERGHPVVSFAAADEERALAAVVALGEEVAPGQPVRTWTCVDGLSGLEAETRDPLAALLAARRTQGPWVWVFKDLAPFLERAEVVRALRDLVAELRVALPLRRLVLLDPEPSLPGALADELAYLELGPPGDEDVEVLLGELGEAAGPLRDPRLLAALRALPLQRARGVLRRAVSAGMDLEVALGEAHAEKRRLARRAGVLDYVVPEAGLAGIGGLERLKRWLVDRRGLLSEGDLEHGVPRGVLLMGVSGCGKSLAAKATAALWSLPLFRLDMNLVFSGLHGSPEAAFHRALKTVEAVAPAILWIDEIENGLGLTEDARGGTRNHLFSTFLTWLQEQPARVFVAATANRIEALPAELIRKGRFDQVFFLDLPGAAERRAILEIHLRRQGVDPSSFRLDYLVYDTRGWSGAEIEQAVISARIAARAEGRPFTSEDVAAAVQGMVPLSQTMHEQIRALREWAFGRATRASEAAEEA